MTKHPLSRRQWLAMAAAAPSLIHSQAFAGSAALAADTPRTLLVFLRGAYDAASLLVPLGNTFYDESRPRIRISPPGGTAGECALPLTADWGLHPALAGNVADLAKAGQAVFIPFAGTHDASRSHFETQDSIELGQNPKAAHRDLNSGFMNRLAAALGTRDAMAFSDQRPVAFRGALDLGNVSLKATGKAPVDGKTRQLLAAMYQGQALGESVKEGFKVRDEVNQTMTQEANAMAGDSIGEQVAANRNAINSKGFEAEARRMGLLMRDHYRLGFIDIGGWDTHVNQGHHTGALATRLGELGRGLAALPAALGAQAWQHTTVVVISEFGRTLRENGSRGTDHGHGSVYWLLGGGLASQAAASRVVGEQVAIKPGTLFQNRDLPVLNEYRQVLGGLWQRQFGLSKAAVADIFPGAEPLDLKWL